MPPTDRAMKTLPRSDPLQYISFLVRLGIAKRGKASILHFLPYTHSILLNDTLLQCYGATSCKELSRVNWESSLSLAFGNIKIYGEHCRHIFTAGAGSDVMYLLPSDSRLYILSMSNFRNLSLLDSEWHVKEDSRIPDLVYGLTISTESGDYLAMASSDLLRIEPVNQRLLIIELSRPKTLILVSTTCSMISLARKALSAHYIYHVNEFQLDEVPLIEFLDAVSLAFPQAVEDNCIEYLIINTTSRSSNAILRVYGYIDSLEVDGVNIDVYRHSVIRLAIDGKGETHLKLCISTFTPYAYELRRKLFEASGIHDT